MKINFSEVMKVKKGNLYRGIWNVNKCTREYLSFLYDDMCNVCAHSFFVVSLMSLDGLDCCFKGKH